MFNRGSIIATMFCKEADLQLSIRALFSIMAFRVDADFSVEKRRMLRRKRLLRNPKQPLLRRRRMQLPLRRKVKMPLLRRKQARRRKESHPHLHHRQRRKEARTPISQPRMSSASNCSSMSRRLRSSLLKRK